MAYVTLDENDDPHGYYCMDDYNVKDAGKVRRTTTSFHAPG
jgi:hypothetical protein